MTADNADSIDAWTAYWRTGQGASCFGGPDTERRLTAVWNEVVDSLAHGARVLDLATGNGAVARACVARARTRGIDLNIEAVDAAEIDPRKYSADPAQLLRSVRFYCGVRLHALPFPDAVFDAVVSQFGFEYAEESAAAAEAVRVLGHGGRLRLAIHARDGGVAADVGRRLERLRGVLDSDGPVALVLALARAAERRDAATLRDKSTLLPAAIETTRRLRERPPADDAALFYSREFLQLWSRRKRYRPSDLRRSLEQGWTNARGVAIRQAEMLRVARSAEDIAGLIGTFRAAGLAVDPPRPIRDERRGIQLAWLVDARKPA
jgi:SAM-dependent methyltransferase